MRGEARRAPSGEAAEVSHAVPLSCPTAQQRREDGRFIQGTARKERVGAPTAGEKKRQSDRDKHEKGAFGQRGEQFVHMFRLPVNGQLILLLF